MKHNSDNSSDVWVGEAEPATTEATTGLGLQKSAGNAAPATRGGGSAKMMPMPLITFETSKALTNKGKCQGSVCQYFRFNTGGAKFPNLINNAKYKTSTLDLAQKITDGTFRVTGNEIPSDSDMASMLEGYVKAPEHGECVFWTRR